MDNDHSLTGYVAKCLREDILNGKYKSRDELKEMTIARELGVSRTPVREAIRQLESEGLVEIIPNKATYVVGISAKDVHDIYAMRACLEGMCVRMAMENIDEPAMEKLDEITELSFFYCEKERYDKVWELDNEFHNFLYNAADSKMLKHTLSDFHHYLQRMRHKTLSDAERAKSSVMEHREIVEAIRSRDVEKGVRLAEKHMENAWENIVRMGYL